MIELKKHIHDESNGLWYELVGDYYIPQLTLPTETQRPIGKWGRMHRGYDVIASLALLVSKERFRERKKAG